jgi:hypothetical protein
MKSKLLLLIFTVLFAGSAMAQFAHFPFDTNVIDQQENVQSTPSPAGLSFVEDAARGNVLHFDGIDGFVSLGTNAYNHDEVTLNIWFNWTTEVEFQWWTRVFDFGTHVDKEPPAERNVMFITLFTDFAGVGPAMQWNIHPITWAPGTDSVLRTTEGIQRNRWYMLTMVHHPDYAKLYLDGQLHDEIVLPGLAPKDMAVFEDLFIGRANWPDPLFTGMMDEFTIWDKALTEAEILELYGDFHASVNPISVESARIFSRGNNIRVELSNSDKASIEVYSITGALVYKRENIGAQTDINNLKTGIYLVRVVNDNKTTTQKVMVQSR